MVRGWQDVVLGVVQMSSHAICCHACLAGSLVGAGLEPNDALAGLHGSIIKVLLPLFRVPGADVHTTLQPLCLGPSCQSQKKHLYLCHVSTVKQVTGLKQVCGVHAVAARGLDEVGKVF